VGSPPGMCRVRLHGGLITLERLLARSRTNVCLSGGGCNDPTAEAACGTEAKIVWRTCPCAEAENVRKCERDGFHGASQRRDFIRRSGGRRCNILTAYAKTARQKL